MFGDIENFAIRAADYFYEEGDLSRSNEYYRLSMAARRKIKKGKLLMKISRILFTVILLGSIAGVILTNDVPVIKAPFHVADDRADSSIIR
ncbi:MULTISPECIES: hypothetical protein [Bacillus amyloliquefaciens group]|uniref:hypothetical protein n=1 Tax=Bacillus amyloliquefaciens group TaxID=1938374 RepID=UPI0019122520|nr:MULTISPECIES: hypothetical protein [Bacillus amyloliquefaciens group]MDQ8093814.1 hypothetical protein [Bacillus amyloliquefaciens]